MLQDDVGAVSTFLANEKAGFEPLTNGEGVEAPAAANRLRLMLDGPPETLKDKRDQAILAQAMH